MFQEATNVQNLTLDLTVVTKKVLHVEWQCGCVTMVEKIHNIRRDAVAGWPGVRAVRRPDHHGRQVLTL